MGDLGRNLEEEVVLDLAFAFASHCGRDTGARVTRKNGQTTGKGDQADAAIQKSQISRLQSADVVLGR